jgi:hypothetical protein
VSAPGAAGSSPPAVRCGDTISAGSWQQNTQINNKKFIFSSKNPDKSKNQAKQNKSLILAVKNYNTIANNKLIYFT